MQASACRGACVFTCVAQTLCQEARMNASHRSRLHQLDATHKVRKPAFRGIKRTPGVVPKWTANIHDHRLARWITPSTWAPTPAPQQQP